MFRSGLIYCGAAGAALSLGAASAVAGLTPMGTPGGHEASQEQILEHVYGTDFTKSGADFVGSNGLKVSRVDDAADKTVVFSKPTRVDLVAVFTNWKWDYSMSDAGGGRVGGGSQAGTGFNTSGGFDVAGDAVGKPLQFVLDHRRPRREYRSGDAMDQLMTYKVSDATGRDETVFFWEDWSRRQHPRGDFNDLVFRAASGGDLSGGGAPVSANAVSIPLPPAVWPGAAMLLGVTLTATRRYRRR